MIKTGNEWRRARRRQYITLDANRNGSPFVTINLLISSTRDDARPVFVLANPRSTLSLARAPTTRMESFYIDPIIDVYDRPPLCTTDSPPFVFAKPFCSTGSGVRFFCYHRNRVVSCEQVGCEFRSLWSDVRSDC